MYTIKCQSCGETTQSKKQSQKFCNRKCYLVDHAKNDKTAICEYCNKNKVPFILSLFVTSDSKILSGESLNEVLKCIADFNPIAIGINCISPVVFNKIVDGMESPLRWGFYLNCGSGKFTDREIFEGVTPTNYIEIVKKKFKRKPFFIGSCCGSSPKHTKAIKEFIIENK